MRSRPTPHRLLRLVATAAAPAMVIATPTTVAGAQPATTTNSEAPATTATSPTTPSASPSPTSPTAGPPSQGTPPEQRRDQATASPGFTTMACEDYWNAAHGRSYTLCGRIRDKYIELGGPASFLGAPTSGEILNPDGVGKRASFEGNSSIYWHPDTDAHQIGGRIGDKWADFGLEAGPLGYPITDELTNPDGYGKRQAFQADSSIYYSEATDAHQIGGDIGKRWGELRWEASYLGYPTTDEVSTPNGQGRVNHFERGSVYWTGTTGAHDISSELTAVWGALGWEEGELGFPAMNSQIGPDYDPTLRSAPVNRFPQQATFQRGFITINSDGEAAAQLADPEAAIANEEWE